mmetsp:Transcript_57745/g.135036  ORF Transcript_57745/g.135036 Transcript_57745/m.135036 type:complete len:91 (+) Transcript_57745:35-307(+)
MLALVLLKFCDGPCQVTVRAQAPVTAGSIIAGACWVCIVDVIVGYPSVRHRMRCTFGKGEASRAPSPTVLYSLCLNKLMPRKVRPYFHFA